MAHDRIVRRTAYRLMPSLVVAAVTGALLSVPAPPTAEADPGPTDAVLMGWGTIGGDR